LVHVHADADELGKLYRPTQAIHATPQAFAAALNTVRPTAAVPWKAHVEAAHAEYLAWSDTAPIRIPGNLQISKQGKPAEIKRFVCGFVWDYQKERISVMIIDQKTLLQDLHGCIVDPDFGDPQEYDVKITRKVENDFTKYKLVGAPPKALLPAIEEAYEALLTAGADLNVMFDNGNPFEPEVKKDGDEEEDDDDDTEGDEEE
jgi:hypothetical protein